MTGLAILFRPLAAPLAIAALALSACTDDPSSAAPLPDYVMGSKDAKITVTEYASLTCPHCRDFWKQDFPRIKANYIDTGKIRYIYRDFPTDATLAPMLTGLSRCKGESEYYALVEDIFSNWSELTESAQKGEAGPVLLAIGARHGLSKDQVSTCISDKKMLASLNKTISDAQAKGIKVTPTLFIDDQMSEAHAYDDLAKALDIKLGVAPAAPTAPPAGETPAAPATAPATPASAPGN
jgi:protein-disulfide isomerase